jgi:hypothetical protein
MVPKRVHLFTLIMSIFLFVPLVAHGLTAQEILEQSLKQNFPDTFRIPLSVKTYKGQKLVSNHVMWLVGQTKDKAADFFVDFEEPKDAKGLRFLFQTQPGQEPKAFMYLPATKKTLPLSLDDPSVDMGGTGLTMEDVQGFIPREGEKQTLVKEEKVNGQECYLISIALPEGKGERRLWVSKKDLLIVKSENLDSKGKVRRIFRVIEFFKTDQGKEFPREEEIQIPEKNTRIRVRQDGAVFGIEIPEEIMDPEKFGTFNWRN